MDFPYPYISFPRVSVKIVEKSPQQHSPGREQEGHLLAGQSPTKMMIVKGWLGRKHNLLGRDGT